MRIAMPTDDRSALASHFGRAAEFAIFEISGGRAKPEGFRKNEHVHGDHDGGPARDFDNPLAGVDVVICRGMGRRAAEAISSIGAQTVFASKDDLYEIAVSYARGELVAGEPACGCKPDK